MIAALTFIPALALADYGSVRVDEMTSVLDGDTFRAQINDWPPVIGKRAAQYHDHGWHTVMAFSPSLVGCIISAGNHSFEMLRRSGECVINLPTTALTDQVVGVGNSSGGEVDKFERFGLTAQPAERVGAPLIGECHAHFECRLFDDSLVERYDFFIWEVVARATVSSWWPARSSTGATGSCHRCCRPGPKSLRRSRAVLRWPGGSAPGSGRCSRRPGAAAVGRGSRVPAR